MLRILAAISLLIRGTTGISCYSCIGFEIPGDPKLQNALAALIPDVYPAPLPNSFNQHCMKGPSATGFVGCMSMCLSVTASINSENFGILDELKEEFELNGQYFAITKEYIQKLGTINIAMRTCLDDVLDAVGIDRKEIGMYNITHLLPEEPACVDAAVEDLFGVSGNAKVCGCASNMCNHITPSAAEPAKPMSALNSVDFVRECPAHERHLYEKLNHECHNHCESDWDCTEKPDRMCCDGNVQCVDYYGQYNNDKRMRKECRTASYTRRFDAFNCSRMAVSNDVIQNHFDSAKTDMLKTMEGRVPPIGPCRSPKEAPITNECKTFAFFADLHVSATDYFGPTDNIPPEFYEMFEMSTLNELGEASGTFRGCLDKIVPEMLQGPMPKFPETKGCATVNVNLYGLMVSSKVCACNSWYCNDETAESPQIREDPVPYGWSTLSDPKTDDYEPHVAPIEPVINCYSCVGFDIPGDANLQKGLAALLGHIPYPLPNSFDRNCLKNPKDTGYVGCSTMCINVVGSANAENFGIMEDLLDEEDVEFELDGEHFKLSKDWIRSLGTVTVAYRTCVDKILEVIGMHPQDIGLQDIAKSLPDKPACASGSVEAFGVGANGRICACTTDLCNTDPPTPATPAPEPPVVSSGDFTRECPARNRYDYYGLYDQDSECPQECATSSNCHEKDNMCCVKSVCEDYTNLNRKPEDMRRCRKASYTRRFETYNCSRVALSNDALQEHFDSLKNEMMKKTKHRFPPFGECRDADQVAVTGDCKFWAACADVHVSAAKYEGPTEHIPKELYELLEVKSLNELGEASATIRGCFDKMIPEILQESLPKFPLTTNACAEGEVDMYGLTASGYACICNSDKCNNFDVTSPAIRDASGSVEKSDGTAEHQNLPENVEETVDNSLTDTDKVEHYAGTTVADNYEENKQTVQQPDEVTDQSSSESDGQNAADNYEENKQTVLKPNEVTDQSNSDSDGQEASGNYAQQDNASGQNEAEVNTQEEVPEESSGQGEQPDNNSEERQDENADDDSGTENEDDSETEQEGSGGNNDGTGKGGKGPKGRGGRGPKKAAGRCDALHITSMLALWGIKHCLL